MPNIFKPQGLLKKIATTATLVVSGLSSFVSPMNYSYSADAQTPVIQQDSNRIYSAPTPPREEDSIESFYRSIRCKPEYQKILDEIPKFKLKTEGLSWESISYLPGKTLDSDIVRLYCEDYKKMSEEDREKLLVKRKGKKGMTYYFDEGYCDITPELDKNLPESSKLFEYFKTTIVVRYLMRDNKLSFVESRFLSDKCPKYNKKIHVDDGWFHWGFEIKN